MEARPSPAKHSEWDPVYAIDRFSYDQQETLSQLYFSLKKGADLGYRQPDGFWENDPAQAPFAGAGCGCGFDLSLDGHDIRNYLFQELVSSIE